MHIRKRDRRVCTNYRRFFLIRLPVKEYARCLEKRWLKIMEPELCNIQCGFFPDCSITDQILLSSKFLGNLESRLKKTVR